MTLAGLLAMVDEIRPNEYSTEIKTMWANEIEQMVYRNVLSRCLFPPDQPEQLNYAENPEQVLVVPDEFGDVYTGYLYTKIDFANGEIERYNNDAMMFGAAFDEYAKWYRRTHLPHPLEGFPK